MGKEHKKRFELSLLKILQDLPFPDGKSYYNLMLNLTGYTRKNLKDDDKKYEACQHIIEDFFLQNLEIQPEIVEVVIDAAIKARIDPDELDKFIQSSNEIELNIDKDILQNYKVDITILQDPSISNIPDVRDEIRHDERDVGRDRIEVYAWQKERIKILTGWEIESDFINLCKNPHYDVQENKSDKKPRGKKPGYSKPTCRFSNEVLALSSDLIHINGAVGEIRVISKVFRDFSKIAGNLININFRSRSLGTLLQNFRSVFIDFYKELDKILVKRPEGRPEDNENKEEEKPIEISILRRFLIYRSTICGITNKMINKMLDSIKGMSHILNILDDQDDLDLNIDIIDNSLKKRYKGNESRDKYIHTLYDMGKEIAEKLETLIEKYTIDNITEKLEEKLKSETFIELVTKIYDKSLEMPTNSNQDGLRLWPKKMNPGDH